MFEGSQCQTKRLLLSLIVVVTVVLAILLIVVLTRTGSDKGDSPAVSNSHPGIDDETATSTTTHVTDITPTTEGICLGFVLEAKRLYEQLKFEKGVKYEVDADSLGSLTFGIGHLITKDDPEYGTPVGTPVSEERVREAFRTDLEMVMKVAYAWSSDCNAWPSEVKEIIANMMFSLGRDRMNESAKFKVAIQARDWESAADEMAGSQLALQDKDKATRMIHLPRNVATGISSLILTETEQGRLEKQLRIDEGIKYAVLLDYRFFKTFGIGHVITSSDPEYRKPEGTNVTDERVKEAFEADF